MSDSNVDLKKHIINEKSELGGISFAPVDTGGDAESIIHTELLKDTSYSRKRFKPKDEVSLKRVTSKVRQRIKGITTSKVGRVIRVVDKENQIVEVDFWDTVPARFSVKMSMLVMIKSAPSPFIKKVKDFIARPIIMFLHYIIEKLK